MQVVASPRGMIVQIHIPCKILCKVLGYQIIYVGIPADISFKLTESNRVTLNLSYLKGYKAKMVRNSKLCIAVIQR